jgi:hypothetical protein
MEISRHEGGSDILTSADDLAVALGVRLRERPGARWVVQMHPETLAEFDVTEFEARFGAHDVTLDESSYIVPGEYHLAQSGFGRDHTGAAEQPRSLSN